MTGAARLWTITCGLAVLTLDPVLQFRQSNGEIDLSALGSALPFIELPGAPQWSIFATRPSLRKCGSP